ncbi:MAG: hypothetical protein CM1200mP3_02000 [Chloroflexota bacterium]|nr:MAG: hypothetical protein CM1200mP3_02000 [Chloroflexota bacterium]
MCSSFEEQVHKSQQETEISDPSYYKCFFAAQLQQDDETKIQKVSRNKDRQVPKIQKVV